jgi:hypothetical protein
MSTVPVYTSQTGVDSPEPQIVEHVAPTRVRINDATYGLKTAAKTVRERVEREKFLAQKAEAIGKQRSREQQRKADKIAALDSDIAKIRASLLSGTSSDPVKAKTLLATLEDKRNALSEYASR